MRSRTFCLATAVFALLAILSCVLPGFAEGTAGDINNTPGTISSTPPPKIITAPITEAPADVQNAPTTPADQKPEPRKKGRLVLVPAFNNYYPSNAKTRARFGESWPSIGLSFAWRDANTDPRKIELRLDGMGRKSDDVSAYIFPLGIGVSQRLSTSKSVVTYAGVSANLYFGKIKSRIDNVDTGWRMTAGPGAYLGANIGSRINIQASYYGVPSIGGFGMSGFNLSAHFMLF